MRLFWLARRSTRRAAGFLLVELLLALAIGLALLGQIAQSTLLETGESRRLGRLLRERVVTQRALELIRSEVQDALKVSLSLPQSGHAGCSVSGRTVVLHLLTTAGQITYSVERKPDAIWRGQALMRCGPSYELKGILNEASVPATRVIVDALATDGIVLKRGEASRELLVEVRREFVEPGAALQEMKWKLTIPAPGLMLSD